MYLIDHINALRPEHLQQSGLVKGHCLENGLKESLLRPYLFL